MPSIDYAVIDRDIDLDAVCLVLDGMIKPSLGIASMSDDIDSLF